MEHEFPPTEPIDAEPTPTDLELASPGYLATLGRGLLLAQASLIGFVVLVIVLAIGMFVLTPAGPGGGGGSGAPKGPAGSPATLPSAFLVTLNVLGILTQIAGLAGWWLISSDDPDPETPRIGADGLRSVVRMLLLASVATWLVAVVSPPQHAVLLGAVTMALLLVGFLTRMMLIAHLGERAGSVRVARRARMLMWLGPVLCTVGTWCVGVGALISVALYANMLGWLRADVRGALGERSPFGVV